MTPLSALLSQPKPAIVDFIGGIYEHSPWVAEQADYEGVTTCTQLAQALKQVVDGASHAHKLALLQAHPDLCEKVGALEKLTKESQEEQSRSGLQSLTEDEMQRFQTTNEAYRTKCGFPFILAVRNVTKHTVLAALEGRVNHTVEQEFAIALEQVHKIAWMRILSKIDTSDAEGFLTCHVLDTANGCPGKLVWADLDP